MRNTLDSRQRETEGDRGRQRETERDREGEISTNFTENSFRGKYYPRKNAATAGESTRWDYECEGKRERISLLSGNS